MFDPYRKWLGIQPKDQPPNYYRLLGLDLFEDDLDVVEGAADRAMGFIRQYQSGEHAALAAKLLNECASARLCLLKAVAKAEYDAKLKQELAVSGGATPGGGEPKVTPDSATGVRVESIQPRPQVQDEFSAPPIRPKRTKANPNQMPANDLAEPKDASSEVSRAAKATRVSRRTKKSQSNSHAPAYVVGGVMILGTLFVMLRPNGPSTSPQKTLQQQYARVEPGDPRTKAYHRDSVSGASALPSQNRALVNRQSGDRTAVATGQAGEQSPNQRTAAQPTPVPQAVANASAAKDSVVTRDSPQKNDVQPNAAPSAETKGAVDGQAAMKEQPETTKEELDPIKKGLDAAKVAYQLEKDAFRTSMNALLDRHEKAARKSDNKAPDQVQAEREAFEKWNLMPANVPAVIAGRRTKSRTDMETAFNSAIKAYQEIKSNDAIAATERELQSFRGEEWPHLDLAKVKFKTDCFQMRQSTGVYTKEKFTGPIEIHAIARTERNNIRLHAYRGSAVIFNWEVSPGTLRVARPDGNAKVETGSIAASQRHPLKPGTWYRLRWRITSERMEVAVDGKVIWSEKRLYDVETESPIEIHSEESLLEVRDFHVVRLTDSK